MSGMSMKMVASIILVLVVIAVIVLMFTTRDYGGLVNYIASIQNSPFS